MTHLQPTMFQYIILLYHEVWTQIWDTDTTRTRRHDKSLKCSIRGHCDNYMTLCVCLYIIHIKIHSDWNELYSVKKKYKIKPSVYDS